MPPVNLFIFYSVETTLFYTFIFSFQPNRPSSCCFLHFEKWTVLRLLDIIGDYCSGLWPHEAVHVDLVSNNTKSVCLVKYLLFVCEVCCQECRWVRQVKQELVSDVNATLSSILQLFHSSRHVRLCHQLWQLAWRQNRSVGVIFHFLSTSRWCCRHGVPPLLLLGLVFLCKTDEVNDWESASSTLILFDAVSLTELAHDDKPPCVRLRVRSHT